MSRLTSAAAFGVMLMITAHDPPFAQQPPHDAAEVKEFVRHALRTAAAGKGRPFIEIPSRDSLLRLIECRAGRRADSLGTIPCHMIGVAREHAVTVIGDVKFTDSVTAQVSVGTYGESRRGASSDRVTWIVRFANGKWVKIGEALHVVE